MSTPSVRLSICSSMPSSKNLYFTFRATAHFYLFLWKADDVSLCVSQRIKHLNLLGQLFLLKRQFSRHWVTLAVSSKIYGLPFCLYCFVVLYPVSSPVSFSYYSSRLRFALGECLSSAFNCILTLLILLSSDTHFRFVSIQNLICSNFYCYNTGSIDQIRKNW